MKYIAGNILSFSLMILMNSLANILPINGKTTREISDQYPNLFVPAGITFSIWAVIYLLLFVFVLMQFFGKIRIRTTTLGWWITINFLLNASWIIAWHYEFVSVSLAVMIALLTTLAVINRRLGHSSEWILRLTFGIYLGWICLATIANITAVMVAYSWAGWGISEQVWTIIMIIAGAVIGAVVMYKLRNPFLTLSLVWGFYGIVLKRQIDHPEIAISAYLAMAIVLFTSLWVVLVANKQSSKAIMSAQ